MVIALSALLVVVCVGGYLVLYLRHETTPGGPPRRRRWSKPAPDALEADYQASRLEDGGGGDGPVSGPR